MKKLIVFLFVVSTLFMLINQKDTEVIIPTESIRFRLIANSNKDLDQMIKLNVKEEITSILTSIEDNSSDINESRVIINNSIPLIEDKLEELNLSYDIKYGVNNFPVKEYKGVTYESGNYESLVITLGKGLGDNWWCVLFPPLCTVEQENLEEKEYSLYINNIINRST